MKISNRTIDYFIIAAVSSILLTIGLLLRKTTFGGIMMIRQILDVAPNFILCIAIPLLLLGIIRLVKIPKKETRLLYYFIFILLIGVTSSEYAFILWNGAKFDIFDIIASSIGLFVAAAIHNYFEIKENQVPQ